MPAVSTTTPAASAASAAAALGSVKPAKPAAVVVPAAAAAILPPRLPIPNMSVSTQTLPDPSPPVAFHAASHAELLAAIKAGNEKVMVKIDHLASDISLIRHDMDKFRSRFVEAESRISQLEDVTSADSRNLRALQLQVKALQDKSIDTENRMRRNNLRIVGLPEKTEGNKPAEFVESFLISLLDLPAMSPTFVVERAHRIPPTPPAPGNPPRPLLLRLLNFRDRDKILAAARDKQELRFNNAKIMLFPDYSPEVQQRRRAFTEVRRRLRDKGLKFSLLYPSKLRVADGDRTFFFTNPEAAISWLDGRG